MMKIREAIVVEGRYDKNKLCQIVDTMIIETAGFGIFNDREKRALLQIIAHERGLIILTDSDSAGFVIRNHLRGVLPCEEVKHAYIPQIKGKERRKDKVSKEGILGVEGVTTEIIIDALLRAGATFLNEDITEVKRRVITKTDLYMHGLSGRSGSATLRQKLLQKLRLPSHMTTNALLEALQILMDVDEFEDIINTL